MALEFELNAEPRADLGKGASRRLRLKGDLVPAIIYGGGEAPESISIPHKDLMKATENEAFFSHILTINVGSSKATAIIMMMAVAFELPTLMVKICEKNASFSVAFIRSLCGIEMLSGASPPP